MDRVSDNFNNDFPARMSDGRFMTNYWPNCALNSSIQGEMNSYLYRQFLTNNASSLMENMNKINKAEYGCDTCFPEIKIIPQSRYVQECTEDGCTVKEVNPKGIGIRQRFESLKKKAQGEEEEEVEEDVEEEEDELREDATLENQEEFGEGEDDFGEDEDEL